MAFPDRVDLEQPSRLDRLQIAFAVKVARAIVDADGVLDLGEIELLTMAFPTPMMENAGFLDAQEQLTPAVDDAYRKAVSELPRILTMPEKLDLVSLFHRTCMADGELHPTELDILLKAAVMLDIDEETLRDHLRSLKGGGTLVPAVRRG
jgi:uncharacterized tellurite resistance protein B-like protein